jgi:hypothetical protein
MAKRLSELFASVADFLKTLKPSKRDDHLARGNAEIAHRTRANKQPRELYGAGNPGLAAFLYQPEFRPVSSTHHKKSLYDANGQRMAFEFKDGTVCTVGDISVYEAERYYLAASKGVWYWDVIRVRGKGNSRKTRKPFAYGLPAGIKGPNT